MQVMRIPMSFVLLGACFAICFGGWVTPVALGQGTEGFQLINDAVEASEPSTAYNQSDSRAPAGVFSITATFTNTSTETFSEVFFQVNKISGGNKVLNAQGDGGVGSRVNGPAVLAPGASTTVTFEIGLEVDNPFEFFVDVFGKEGSGDMDADSFDVFPVIPTPPETLVLDLFDDPVGEVGSFGQAGDILGGERDFMVDSFGAGPSGTFDYTGDSFSAEMPGIGGANFIYDGVDGSHNRDWRGLGGVDVTNGGAFDEFFLTLNDVQGHWFLQIFIHPNDFSFFGGGLPVPMEGPFPQDLILPLADMNPTGNPSFDDIGLIGIFLQNSPEPGSTTLIEIDKMGFRSSDAIDPTVQIPLFVTLEQEALDVLVPFGPDNQLVRSDIKISGEGSGTATMTSFERPKDQAASGDPLSLQASMDILYDVTFFDVDPDIAYAPEFGSSVTLSQMQSSLVSEYIGIIDTTKVNWAAIVQATDWNWMRDSEVSLPDGRTLFIPSTQLHTDFADQTLFSDIADELIFADGFESGDTSAWSVNPTFDVNTAGTLTLHEIQVIAPVEPNDPNS